MPAIGRAAAGRFFDRHLLHNEDVVFCVGAKQPHLTPSLARPLLETRGGLGAGARQGCFARGSNTTLAGKRGAAEQMPAIGRAVAGRFFDRHLLHRTRMWYFVLGLNNPT
jgi:hypothetical protein